MSKRAKRSLQLSLQGIEQAKKALTAKALSQTALAKQLQITRQTLSKFFRGERVDRQYFIQLSESLDLEWDEISEPFSIEQDLKTTAPESNRSQLDVIVHRLYQQGYGSIQHRYGTMRVLDMSQPIPLNKIYIDVHVLETIQSRRRLEVADLGITENYSSLNKNPEERILGLQAIEKYSRLIILGKPASGKTTFLKYLALQGDSGIFPDKKLPIFISLKDFVSTERNLNLQNYIQRIFFMCYEKEINLFKKLLYSGRFLILLDGLDEVSQPYRGDVIREINKLADDFYKNHFVISCRLAAIDHRFEKFTEVELSEFDQQQIIGFVKKWFLDNECKQKKLIDEIQGHYSIKDLATNPLLLTFLCLVFEQSNSFPQSRSELYKEAIDILLKTWDTQRSIERTGVGEKISVQRQEDLLNQIAFFTATQGRYLFKQKEIEQYIATYLHSLPNNPNICEDEPLDSYTVVKSIEAQHGILVERAKGIYSFSHLIFHEYLTAKAIVASPTSNELNKALQLITRQITNKFWQEVGLLTAEMLPKADPLLELMKQQIDGLVAEDKQLQKFLTWLDEKAGTVPTAYESAIIRAFYFDLSVDQILGGIGSTLTLARALNPKLTDNFELELAFDLAIECILALNQVLALTDDPIDVLGSVISRALNYANLLENKQDNSKVLPNWRSSQAPSLRQLLQDFHHQANLIETISEFQDWWQGKGKAWIEALRTAMIEQRNVGHNWQFNQEQVAVLKQYYNANEFLVNCLKRAESVTPEVNEAIQKSLLLPVAKLKK
ncbi:NACHT domain-containing protein [Coleofasciculus sp.]|uniref:NACHT domain-containing protein n=1 Tax=Coleofasciculus sp. TaxID=3100458 RepID=UPI0039FAD1D5